jgi:trimeric autotransporter adhesin
VGIGTAAPTATLDVNGSALVSGTVTAGGVTANGVLEMAPTGTATASTGYNSQIIKMYSSAYNSSSKAVVNPRFEWEALVTGNDTAAPSATLALLSSTTAAGAAPTGFYFNTNGTINFAPGQTFPGVGTITGVTAGTGLTGGGTSGNVTLTVNPAVVPELATSNSFTASQSISSGDLNLPATTSALSGVINIGGRPFLHGYTSGNANVFVGGAGNFTTTGSHLGGFGLGALGLEAAGTDNTASGWAAGQEINSGSFNSGYGSASMFNITTGSYNTAIGYYSDGLSLTGSYNTGIGAYSLESLTTGTENSALGYGASPGTTSGAINNSTALGAFSTVSQSNSMVLGQTYQGKPGFDFVNVGIGTDTPRSTLEAAVDISEALGPALTLTNSGSGTNTAAAVDFNTYLPSTSGSYNPGARIEAIDDGFSDFGTNLFFSLNKVGAQNDGLQTDMVINSSYGAVGIGLTNPQSYGDQLVVFAASGVDAVYGQGRTSSLDYYSSSGVIGQGGDNTSGSYSAGDGGIFFGGDSSGSAAGGDGVQGIGGSSGSGSTGYAGHFFGNVDVTGTLTAGTKDFKIDHPLDPANKYLVHSSVESSEMVNIYSGNVVTDEDGLATVQLPDWFEAENGDFRYQLTVVGGRFAQAIVSKEIANHQFAISTNASRVKVSWQVTAVRQDAYAKANPLVVEPQKPSNERGFYIHPELYGQPQEKQTEWGRHPQQMQRMKAMREQKLQAENGATQAPAALSHDQPASAANRQFTRPTKPALKPIAGAKP